MSEQETRSNVPVSDSTSQSIGTRLAQARDAKGWSQDYVSERLKFSLRQLRALEAEEWEKLPQGVPLRGFVRNYARLLDIDVTPQLSSLPGNADPVSLSQASTLTTPLANARASIREWPTGSRTRRRRPATWLVGVLMLLVAVVLIVLALYRQGKLPDFSPVLHKETANSVPARPILATPPIENVNPAPLALESLEPAQTLLVQPVPSSLGDVQTQQTVLPAPASELPQADQQVNTTAAPVEPPKPVEPPASVGMALSLTQDTWFEVRRANGSVVISRVLKVGEAYQLDPKEAPYSVVIGNIQGAKLTWRGEPVDLSGFRSNVARLTLQ